MKLSKPHFEQPYTSSYRRNGRKKGYKAQIIYNSIYRIYYFRCDKDGKTYNSCWDKLEFATEEECMIACEKWIDEN